MLAIRPAVNEAFQRSQSPAESHRTLSMSLRTTHLGALGVPGGSDAFFASFARCVDRVVALARKDATGARVTEFVAAYAAAISGEDDAGEAGEPEEVRDQLDQFGERLLLRYAAGFTAAAAPARFHCVRLVAKLLPFAAVADAEFDALVDAALARLHDSDTHVRVQAAMLVSSLELTERTRSALAAAMQHDPSSELRLMAAYNIAHDGTVLERVVDRIRDASPVIRRAMYAKILASIDVRHLTIRARVKVVQNGLSDRDAGVRKAARALVAGKWVAATGNNVAAVLHKLDPVANPQAADLVLRTFFEMRPDIVDRLAYPRRPDRGGAPPSSADYRGGELGGDGHSAGTPFPIRNEGSRINASPSSSPAGSLAEPNNSFAGDAGRQPSSPAETSGSPAENSGSPADNHAGESVLDYGFTRPFFANLWVDDVLMLRGFQEYCVRERLHDQLEAGMPELYVLAAEIERLVQALAEAGPDDDEEWLETLPFMIEQLLVVASRYDLDDEAGRRRITAVTNVLVTGPLAPSERAIEHIVAIQRRLNASDTAFVSWAFETLTSIPAARDASRVLADMLRAVVLFRCVLALVAAPDVAVYLPSIYDEHLVEALHSPSPEIRIPAAECLALAALLDDGFAARHFATLASCARRGETTLGPGPPDEFVAREAAVGIAAVTDLILNSDRVLDHELAAAANPDLSYPTIIPADISRPTIGAPNQDTSADTTANPPTLTHNTNNPNTRPTNPEHQDPAETSVLAGLGPDGSFAAVGDRALPFPYSHLEATTALLVRLLASASPKVQGAASLGLAKLVLAGRVLEPTEVLQQLLTLYFRNEPLQAEDEDVGLMQQQLTLFLRAYTISDPGKRAVASIFERVTESFLALKAATAVAVTLGDIFVHFLDLTAPAEGPAPAAAANGAAAASAHTIIARCLLDWIFTSSEAAVRRAATNALSKVRLDRTSGKSLAELDAVLDHHASAVAAMTAAMRTLVEKFRDRLQAARTPDGNPNTLTYDAPPAHKDGSIDHHDPINSQSGDAPHTYTHPEASSLPEAIDVDAMDVDM